MTAALSASSPPPQVPALPLARFRFTARFEADLVLPDYAGSLLRGAFGAALRRAACTTGLGDCKACPLWRSCPYPALFETPPRPTQFEQRFSQVPNPYVIEPPAAGTRRIGPGQPLVFHMVLIGADSLRQLPLVVYAWQRALEQGLGPAAARARGRLEAVELVPQGAAAAPVQVYDPATRRLLGASYSPGSVQWSLPAAPQHRVSAVHLDLLTPLRLQHNGRALGVAELTPRTLVSQLLRRVNLMLDLHLGLCPAPFDAQALVALAERLGDDRSQLHWMDWARYSARQRQEMPLGGVLGRWTLLSTPGGDPAPLLPWLALGQWLHLGKNATLGLGAMRMEVVEHVTWDEAPAPALPPVVAHAVAAAAGADGGAAR